MTRTDDVVVELLNGQRHVHSHCSAQVLSGVLVVTIISNGYSGGDWVASYPLTSVARWTPA